MSNRFERAIVDKGFSDGPIPVNTLYTEPQTLYAEPLVPHSTTSSSLMTTGVNRDTLLKDGWVDLSKGPQALYVPDIAGRYYSVQFTNLSDGTDFAYNGTHTTGRQADDCPITGPGWNGQVPGGMKQIASPNNSVLVIGRVLVESDSDRPFVYELAKQIQLVPLSQK